MQRPPIHDVKILLILCSDTAVDLARELLEAHGVTGYTEITGALGSGATGKHLGTRAWPGSSSLIMSAVASDRRDELTAALRSLAASCPAGEGMKLFELDATELI